MPMPAHGPILEFWFDLAAPTSVSPRLTGTDLVAAFKVDSAEHLGSGSFAESWKIGRSGSVEAVKVILEPAYPLERLEQEAEGLRRGACDHVVRLIDVGRESIGGEDRAYFRCEYVEGGDTAHHLRNGHWPGEDEQVAFCRGVLTGLSALHEANSVHRDVKFENVALRNGNWSEPVVLDLGLVRIEDRASLTAYPALMGTPQFMAPEQVRLERAKKATDLWALGTMMFVLAERRHPFYGDYNNRVALPEALNRMSGGPPDTTGCPAPIRDLIKRWLDPTMYRRGSARTALQRLDSGGMSS